MSAENDLKEVLMRMLHAIRKGDIATYKELSSEDLTCFEPETQGHPVDGLPFHLFFMEHTKSTTPYHIELVRPTIRVYGDTGYTAYTLIQNKIKEGKPLLTQVNETRIWNKIGENWKMVHFHRS